MFSENSVSGLGFTDWWRGGDFGNGESFVVLGPRDLEDISVIFGLDLTIDPDDCGFYELWYGNGKISLRAPDGFMYENLHEMNPDFCYNAYIYSLGLPNPPAGGESIDFSKRCDTSCPDDDDGGGFFDRHPLIKKILTGLALLSVPYIMSNVDVVKENKGSVVVVVNETVRKDVNPSLSQYAADLSAEGYNVDIINNSGFSSPDKVWKYLSVRHKNESLTGVLFVGNNTLPWHVGINNPDVSLEQVLSYRDNMTEIASDYGPDFFRDYGNYRRYKSAKFSAAASDRTIEGILRDDYLDCKMSYERINAFERLDEFHQQKQFFLSNSTDYILSCNLEDALDFKDSVGIHDMESVFLPVSIDLYIDRPIGMKVEQFNDGECDNFVYPQYYMNLDGSFLVLNGTVIGNTDPSSDIWVGWLPSHLYAVDEGGNYGRALEAGIIDEYFRNNHVYRSGGRESNGTMLYVASSDFFRRGAMFSERFPEMVIVNNSSSISEEGLLQALQGNLSYLCLASHSNSTAHSVDSMPPGNLTMAEVNGANAVIIDGCGCRAGNPYVPSIGGSYVLKVGANNSVLVYVGSTTHESSEGYYLLYGLNNGSNVGDSVLSECRRLKNGNYRYRKCRPDSSVIIIGDPTIHLDPESHRYAREHLYRVEVFGKDIGYLPYFLYS